MLTFLRENKRRRINGHILLHHWELISLILDTNYFVVVPNDNDSNVFANNRVSYFSSFPWSESKKVDQWPPTPQSAAMLDFSFCSTVTRSHNTTYVTFNHFLIVL